MVILKQLQQLGPLTYPLLACSLLVMVIILERLVIMAMVSGKKQLDRRGLELLYQHAQRPKDVREEILTVWLIEQKRRLATGIRLLQIIAVIAPLLGLLGTVLGLIQVFDGLIDHQGPIEPAMLAGGLGLAMKTTAAGLLIAVPAVCGAQGLQLWVDKLIATTEQTINLTNLHLDGLITEAPL
jgi:biopolymer transport protein ExbB